MTANPLQRSYQYCAEVARREARNFYYAFLVLPREKRRAFCAIYAFLRRSDDISDDTGATAVPRRQMLESWRQKMAAALNGDYGDSPLLPAFHDTVRRYQIPTFCFSELFRGAEMDLEGTRFSTFDELYRYCYRVAGVVGLMCVHIFGFPQERREEALRRAESCGIAFQLTNILRDLREDAGRGRVYLPDEDLQRFGYSRERLLAGETADAYYGLVRFEAERARHYYREALPLLDIVSRDSRPALWSMVALYGGILRRMEAQGFPMLTRRVELGSWRKAGILARAWWMRLAGQQAVPQVG